MRKLLEKCQKIKEEFALLKEKKSSFDSFFADKNFALARIDKIVISAIVGNIRIVVSPDDLSDKDMLKLLDDYEENVLGKNKD